MQNWWKFIQIHQNYIMALMWLIDWSEPGSNSRMELECNRAQPIYGCVHMG